MKVNLYHFFPDKLNLYGDRGNILTLQKRCQWRGIELVVKEIKNVSSLSLNEADFLFIGGGSDREQSLCTEQLSAIKNEIKSAIEDHVTMLTICGGYQFLGDYYTTADGEKLKGLGILDLYTECKGERIIGNLLIESEQFGPIAGFENHGGKTYHDYPTLGKVIQGGGNNGEDKKEGIVYKSLIGTYLHGPLLPKNPQIADWLLDSALKRKYGNISLQELDNTYEEKANRKIWDMYQKR
jgi:CobQ-like glutamine amidotransferase family enzyme